MIWRAIRLATWPARTAYHLADEALWMARALAEVHGYGLGDDSEPYIWALTNEEIDELLK